MSQRWRWAAGLAAVVGVALLMTREPASPASMGASGAEEVRWIAPPTPPLPDAADANELSSMAQRFLDQAPAALREACAEAPCHACVASPFGGDLCREMRQVDGTLQVSVGGRGGTLAVLAHRDPALYESFALCLPFHELPGVRCRLDDDDGGSSLVTGIAGRKLVLRHFPARGTVPGQ